MQGKEISMYNQRNQELFDMENGGNANEKDKTKHFHTLSIKSLQGLLEA